MPREGDLHVAIIMDGNGRWARARGEPRDAGHRAGVAAVRRVVEAAPSLGVRTLTLFAFSTGNWERPALEVAHLMMIFRSYLHQEKEVWAAQGVRVHVIGRRDRLSRAFLDEAEAAEAATAGGRRLHLRIAVDYSARDAVLLAARRMAAQIPRGCSDPSPDALTLGDLSRFISSAIHAGEPAADLDLLIRTGGEKRLSDCLLWEGAYAELLFTDRLWPDFDASDLEAALAEFRSRERRFGRIPETAAKP